MISGAYKRPKKAAALYFNINSGIVFHFDPGLSNHPSNFAISIVTVGPSKIAPDCLSIVTALHDVGVDSNRSVPNRPHEFNEAMINDEPHDGRPWMMCKFCMTIKGDAFIRWAISNATIVFAMFPLY